MVIKKRHQVRFLGGAVIRLGTRAIMALGSVETAAKILLVSPRDGQLDAGFFVNFLGSLNQGQGIKITYPFWNGFEFSPQTFSIHGQEGKGWQIHLAWNGSRVSENQRKIPVWENQNRIRTKHSVYIVKESDYLERITLYHS